MDDFTNALSALGVGSSAPAPSRGPARSGDQQLRAAVSGDMGGDPQSAIREINATQKQLASSANLDPASRQMLVDHISEMSRQLKNIPNAPAAPAQQAAPVDNDFSAALDALNKAPAAAPQQTAQPAKPGSSSDWLKSPEANLALSKDNPQSQVAAHTATGLLSSIGSGYAGLAQGAKTLMTGGGLDQARADAANTVQNVQNAGTYQPQGAQAQKGIATFESPYNPANWIPNASQWAGDKGGDWLSEHGMPGAGAVVKGVGASAPLALGLGKPLSNLVKGAGDAAEVPKIDPTLETAAKPRYKMGPDGKPVLISEGAPPETVAPVTPTGPAPTPQSVPLSQVGKTAAPAAAPVPQTPQAVQTMAQSAPSKLFPETPTTAGEPGVKFSPAEQASRAKILQSVGVDPNSMRTSALTGDALAGSTDFQTSKLDTTGGRLMRAQLDNERNALIDHSSQLVKDTGGTAGLDQSNLYARGNAIVAPLDAMKQWFDTKTSDLYKAADAKAQGVPTQLNGFKGVLEDASERTNSDRVLLPDAVTSYAKKLGMVQEDGSISGTAQQAETLRKYLNEKWSPQNSGMVGKLKDAIDEDVMSAAGSDIYGQARALRAQRAATLDNPKGIAQLMDSGGPQAGMNRSVAIEKIPDKLTGMSVDQFSHVVNTLKNAPPELQPQSAAAMAEIKAQFANKVQEIGSKQAGQWNAKGVTNYLQGNAARMSQVFTPEEIGRFRNLNDAGHILAKDQSYPGAAIQGHNLMTQGVMHALPAAGAGVGATLAGPLGGAAGAFAGRTAANAIGNAAAARAVKGRMTKLSDLVSKGEGQ